MSRLASIDTQSELGSALSYIRFLRDNVWDMKNNRRLFSNYYIRRVTPEQLLSLTLMEGQLIYDGVLYNIIYHNCDSVSVRRVRVKSVLLSFREPKAVTGLKPTVLISGSYKELGAKRNKDVVSDSPTAEETKEELSWD